jgi:S1-C subfamily serine protease
MTPCTGSSFSSHKQAAARAPALLLFFTIAAQLSADVSILRTNARKIADEIAQSVVNIQIIHKEEGQRYYLASFSGIALEGKEHLILTCCGDAMNLLKSKQNHLEVTYKDLWTGNGTLYGMDKLTGLCLIKCASRRNPPKGLSLRTSTENGRFLRKGLRILTISNPFGIDNSVRYGVVSGISQNAQKSPPFIHKLYLPGMPGEGGGCVCDFNGNFAGIIRPIPCETTAQGRRFFVRTNYWPNVEVLPLQVVKPVVESLKNNKTVLRGYIGAKFSLEQQEKTIAVRTTSVVPGGPASQAGLQEDDLIFRIRNRPITSYEDLYRTALWVEYEGLGKTLPITVKRNKSGSQKQLSIRIGLYPEKEGDIPPNKHPLD